MMVTIYEETNGEYEKCGAYELPMLKLSVDKECYIGVWGQRHRRYLKVNHRVRYYNLLTVGKLNAHLVDINQRTEKMFDEFVKSLAEKENVTEKMKADTPMKWVALMNNIRNRATEIVNAEVIYT